MEINAHNNHNYAVYVISGDEAIEAIPRLKSSKSDGLHVVVIVK